MKNVIGVIGLLAAMSAAVVIGVAATGRLTFGTGVAEAQSLPMSPQVNQAYPELGKPLVIQLPPKRKLVGGVSWHCWNGAPCEPWYTTRERNLGDEPRTTYTFSNLNGREIVLQER